MPVNLVKCVTNKSGHDIISTDIISAHREVSAKQQKAAPHPLKEPRPLADTIALLQVKER